MKILWWLNMKKYSVVISNDWLDPKIRVNIDDYLLKVGCTPFETGLENNKRIYTSKSSILPKGASGIIYEISRGSVNIFDE